MFTIKCHPLKASVCSAVLLTISWAQAQTAITSLPFTITAPGTYILASSLTDANGSGTVPAIQINASNVTIDLNGNYISNIPAGPTTQTIGINAFDRANLTIKNGLIVGFSAGILLLGQSTNTNALIENVRLIFNVNGGIQLSNSRGAIITNCQISSTGFSPSGSALNSNSVAIFDSVSLGGNVISNNVISQGTEAGIILGSNDLADNNLIVAVNTGIQGTDSSSKMKNNTVNTASFPYEGGTQLFNNF